MILNSSLWGNSFCLTCFALHKADIQVTVSLEVTAKSQPLSKKPVTPELVVNGLAQGPDRHVTIRLWPGLEPVTFRSWVDAQRLDELSLHHSQKYFYYAEMSH